MNAVKTPSFKSRSGNKPCAALSANKTIAAPPKADAGSNREGTPPIKGRKICGTTNPTNPIAPVTAVAAPTDSAVPDTTISRNRTIRMPKASAASSPNVKASNPRPVKNKTNPPSAINGPASQTWVQLRSANDPISQNMISLAAKGLGDKFNTKDVAAAAKAEMAIPANIKTSDVPRGPANISNSPTATPAPTKANIGKAKAKAAANPV